MIQQGFHIGDRDWYVMCTYDIATDYDLREVKKALDALQCSKRVARKAIRTLSKRNTGLTFTSYDERLTLIFISHATMTEQMYDTIQHELKHAVEHISEYYGVNPRSERAAYLQGEIARQMFPAAAMVVCPECNHNLFS